MVTSGDSRLETVIVLLGREREREKDCLMILPPLFLE